MAMSEEQKRKTEMLEQYGIICRYIEILKRVINKYHDAAFIEKLKKELCQQEQRKFAIDTAINAVSDAEFKAILKYRYIDGLSIEYTGYKLYMSDKTIVRKTLKALEAVEI